MMNPNIMVSPNIILVDGSSYMFRAFYALPSLLNKENLPTGAVYGVIKMLLKLIKKYPDAKILMVFDTPAKTFRHELFAEYKANRQEMPSDLAVQIPYLFDVITAMGLPLLRQEGFEADDIIGSIAIERAGLGEKVLISSSDKDFMQLVSDNIFIENSMTDSIFDTNAVVDKYGLLPEQFRLYLALMGDSSDNIPGVPKVGKVTAAKLVKQYGNLKNLRDHFSNISGKVGSNLREYESLLLLSYELVSIKTDLKIDLENYPANSDPVKLRKLYLELGFKTLVPNFEKTLDSIDIKIISDFVDIMDYVDYFGNSKFLGIKVINIDSGNCRFNIFGVGLVNDDNRALYLNLNNGDSIDFVVIEFLNKLLAKYIIVGHDLKLDFSSIYSHGVNLPKNYRDVMLLGFLFYSSDKYDISSLVDKYLNINFKKIESLLLDYNVKSVDQLSLDVLAQYSAQHIVLSMKLEQYFSSKKIHFPYVDKLYQEIDAPFLIVLLQMELAGINIDTDLLLKHSEYILGQLDAISEQAEVFAGSDINLNSPKQLQKVLFEDLGLPVLEKTSKGDPSTQDSVLSRLSGMHIMPKLIMEHRHLSKLYNTYLKTLPNQLNSLTNRLHTSFNQVGATTGRISSSNPNLQNIPIRGDTGAKIRSAFKSVPGYNFIRADYSQIELRIMAHLSGDTALIASFIAGEDIHQRTASEIFDLDLNRVTKEHRRKAKAINFGLLYGMSPYGLAKNLNITHEDAKIYYDVYFDRYPKIKSFIESQHIFAEKNGYVETIFGRRLYLPDINSKQASKRNHALRVSINAPLQGSASDIIKLASINILNQLNNYSGAQILLQVHDELLLEVPIDYVLEIKSKLGAWMTDCVELQVPLVVNIGSGLDWLSCES